MVFLFLVLLKVCLLIEAKECPMCSVFDMFDTLSRSAESEETPIPNHSVEIRRPKALGSDSSEEFDTEFHHFAEPLLDASKLITSLLNRVEGELHGHAQPDLTNSHLPSASNGVKSRAFDKSNSGEHVCTRERNSRLPQTDQLEADRCDVFSDAVVCHESRNSGDDLLKTIRIKECCEGFETDNIRFGCSKEINGTANIDLLEEQGVNVSLLTSEEKTFIVAANSSEVYILDHQSPTYEWTNGEVLEVNQGSLIVEHRGNNPVSTSLNCVPLLLTNLRSGKALIQIAEKEINAAKGNILKLLEDDGRFQKFLSLLDDETRDDLREKTMTVLAFRDEDFEKLPIFVQERMSNSRGCVKKVIVSHLIHGRKCSSELADSPTPKEVNEELGLHLVRLNGHNTNLVESDLIATNGIVHVIDTVLSSEDLISWEEKVASLNPDLAEKLKGQIPSDQSVTIFVFLNGSSEIYSPLNQVVPWLAPSTFSLPPSITTMDNSTLLVSRSQSRRTRLFVTSTQELLIGCSHVQKHLSVGCDFSIFFIDKPLPNVQQTTEQLLNLRPDFSTFKSILDNVQSALDSQKGFSLLVPVDDAFSVNYLKKINTNSSTAKQYIDRHTTAVICESHLHQMANHQKLTTKFGDRLEVTTEDGVTFIDGNRVLESVITSDGVVHVLETDIEKKPKILNQKDFERTTFTFGDILH